MKRMRVIKTRFPSKEAFFRAYDESIAGGGIFCRTTRRCEPGDEVVIELHFPGLPNKTLLRGTILSWRPAVPRQGVRAGAVVSIMEDEADKRDFILEVARGLRVDGIKRKHPRIPIDRPVRWRRVNALEHEETRLREISIGGGQLATDEELELDEDIFLELMMPGGASAISLAAKVTNKTAQGYGLRFIYRDAGGSRRLREMIRRLVDRE